MPEFISVDEFIAETLEDYSSPTTSSFITKMTSCRNSVNNIEEVGCLYSLIIPSSVQGICYILLALIPATLTAVLLYTEPECGYLVVLENLEAGLFLV